MIELRKEHIKSDPRIRHQEVVHFVDAAVVILITRGVVGIQNDVSNGAVMRDG